MGTHKYIPVLLILLLLLTALPSQAAPKKHAAAKSGAAHAAHAKSSSGKSARHGGRHAASDDESAAAPAKRGKHAAQSSRAAKKPVAKPAPFRPSADLRPMGLQLMRAHTPAAYAGVERYARAHAATSSGSLAWLAIGYARLQDKQYPQALAALHNAEAHAGELSDYVNYFTAKAYDGSERSEDAIATLQNFDRSPSVSIFANEASVLYAEALTKQSRAADAVAVLRPLLSGGRSDVQLAYGKAQLRSGATAAGVATLRQIYYHAPTTDEAAEAAKELAAVTEEGAAPYTERMERIRLLGIANRWSQASEELRQLQTVAPAAIQPDVTAMLGIAMRHLNSAEAYTLLQSPAANAEINAQRLYNLGELARSAADEAALQNNLALMRAQAAHSYWFEQALLSAGNYYLLKKDYVHAGPCYSEAAKQRPQELSSPASLLHWKAAWLEYRLGHWDNARQLFEEQVRLYPGGTEVPAALYWRARLAEQSGDAQLARHWYAACAQRFANYYYGTLSADKLRHMTAPITQSYDLSLFDHIPPVAIDAAAAAQTEPPADNLRYRKSTLLANAGMTEFAVRELQSAGGGNGANWATLRIAQIFIEQDNTHRALYFLKKALYGYYAYNLKQLPRVYWEILFPTPYWSSIRQYSADNGLDPYLVASLIRQESEFNAGAVSKANAYGLMQLLPSVGQQVGRELKMRRVNTAALVNPEINLKLGTRYFAQLLSSYNGQVEYALAAYNGGANRVDDWRAAGNFRDVPEFVESIPFTETREYVQAIMRNAKIYQMLYPQAKQAEE